MALFERVGRQAQAAVGAPLKAGAGKFVQPAMSLLGRRQEPIVLMHGFMGFRAIGPFQYFTGVREALQLEGFRAYTPTVAPINTFHHRGYSWFYGIPPTGSAPNGLDPLHHPRPRLRRPPYGPGSSPALADIFLRHRRKLHLIAHSQAGVGARYLTSPEGLGNLKPFDSPEFDADLRDLTIADTIATITTVSTPHNGALLLDNNVEKMSGLVSKGVLPLIDSLMSLISRADSNMEEACKEFGREFMLSSFNPKYPEHPDVRYYSVAGMTNEFQVSKLLRPLYELIKFDPAFEGEDSDGFVPISSSRWPVVDTEPEPSLPITLPRIYRSGGDLRETHGNWNFLGYVYADHVNEMGLPLAEPYNTIFDHLSLYRGLAKFVSGEFAPDVTLRFTGNWSAPTEHDERRREWADRAAETIADLQARMRAN